MATLREWHLTLTAESPVLIGDRKPDALFSESLEQIPGDRVRAAFARAILADCRYFDPGAQPRGQQYWVTYKDQSECVGCRWQTWCAAFGELQFGQATPDGAAPLPLTAMLCKSNAEAHPLRDVLAAQVVWQQRLRELPTAGGHWQRPAMTCGHDACGGRMERKAGWYDPQTLAWVAAPKRVTMTRLQIDGTRGVKEDGQLYSLRPLAEGARFRLMVRAPAAPPEELTLAVGARTSTGMGRCAVTLAEAPVRTAVGDRVAAFNRLIRSLRQAAGLGESSQLLAPVTLRSPLFLADFDPVDPATLSNAASLDRLQAALGLPEAFSGWSLVHAVTAYGLRGGWHLKDGGWSPARHRLEAGSVLVFGKAVAEGAAQALTWLEEHGLGSGTADGFGAVSVCDRYHTERAVTFHADDGRGD